jgi:hypothetical protein
MGLLVRSLLRVCSSSLIPFGTRILTSRIAQVPGDGRDLVVLSKKRRVASVFIRDCRGETTFELTGLVLGIRPEDICCSLGFEHGRACVATVRISQSTLVIAVGL